MLLSAGKSEPAQDRNFTAQLEAVNQVFGLFPTMVLEPEIVGKLTLEAEPVVLGLDSLRFRIVIHIADGAQPRMPGGRYIGVTLRASQRVGDRYFQAPSGKFTGAAARSPIFQHYLRFIGIVIVDLVLPGNGDQHVGSTTSS